PAAVPAAGAAAARHVVDQRLARPHGRRADDAAGALGAGDRVDPAGGDPVHLGRALGVQGPRRAGPDPAAGRAVHPPGARVVDPAGLPAAALPGGAPPAAAAAVPGALRWPGAASRW